MVCVCVCVRMCVSPFDLRSTLDLKMTAAEALALTHVRCLWWRVFVCVCMCVCIRVLFLACA